MTSDILNLAEQLGFASVKTSNFVCQIFKKGFKQIWLAGYDKNFKPQYKCADIVENHLVNHRAYNDLQTALNTEK